MNTIIKVSPTHSLLRSAFVHKFSPKSSLFRTSFPFPAAPAKRLVLISSEMNKPNNEESKNFLGDSQTRDLSLIYILGMAQKSCETLVLEDVKSMNKTLNEWILENCKKFLPNVLVFWVKSPVKISMVLVCAVVILLASEKMKKK